MIEIILEINNIRNTQIIDEHLCNQKFFFEKLNKIDKPLEILIEEKNAKKQSMNLRNKRDPIGIKRIIREYNELVSANKSTIDEMHTSFIK